MLLKTKTKFKVLTRKKISGALLMLLMGANLNVGMAHENEEGKSLNYSVFSSYRSLKGTKAQQAYSTQQYAKTMLPGWSAVTDKLTGNFRDMYGPAASIPGAANMDKVQWMMKTKLAPLGVQTAEWALTRNAALPHASYVDFEQVLAGHKVVFSSLSFRFTPDGRLQRVKMSNFGSENADMQPVLTANDVLNGNSIKDGMNGMGIQQKEVNADWVWFPVPSERGYALRPAWEYTMSGTGAEEMPFELTGYVDAISGELLYRSNSVNETFEVTVKGSIYMASPTQPVVEEPIMDMRLNVAGNNYVTDTNGTINIPSVSAPASVTFNVAGPWSVVREGGNNISFNANIATSPGTYILPIADTSSKEFRAVTAFYHVNKIHDYMKSKLPSFTGMDGSPLTTNIDLLQSQQCNAFYSNGNYSINFYPPQTTCRAFSIVSDIVYHEYGHGICYRFYSANGQNFRNGAMGEGYSDVWALALNRDGIVGDGAFMNGGNIRSYTGAPKVYPADIRGQVHADGEIIAGAWWDVANNIGDIEIMADIFAESHYDLPNAPNGMEGPLYHDILISALLADDDDATFSNRTPHFDEIVKAFARHGIFLLADAEFQHTEVAHQPVNTPVTISGNLNLTNPAFFDKILMHYRNRYDTKGWDSVAMVNVTGNTYSAQIPGQPGGAIVDYYFTARDVINAGVSGIPDGYSPYIAWSEATIPYQFAVGLGYPRYKNDFEGSIDGWQLGLPDDDATEGQWVHVVPVATYTTDGKIIQPGNDNTTGSGKCLVTGNGASFGSDHDEVQGGRTTVMTPSIDVPFHNPIIEYYRWYSNDLGNNSNLRTEYWTVEMRNGSSLFWQKVDYSRQADRRWRRRIFRASEFIPSPDKLQLRFIAEDAGGANVVEAAIDDFVIYDGSPTSVANATTIKAEVYPNPADDKVNVVLPSGSKGSISLYDVTGKVISKVDVNDNTTKYAISTAGLPNGTYMLLMQTQFAIQNTKIVVAHQ